MIESVLIPRWLYEREVAKNGKEATDRVMRDYNIVAVADWRTAVDLEAVKEKVNRG